MNDQQRLAYATYTSELENTTLKDICKCAKALANNVNAQQLVISAFVREISTAYKAQLEGADYNRFMVDHMIDDFVAYMVNKVVDDALRNDID